MSAYKPDARYLTSQDGTTIYADAIGDPSKPHLIFVHGFSCATVVFDRIFDDSRYAEQYYLVRYDMRGHGRTGKPRDIEGYASERFAQDFAAVVEAFSLKRPVYIGWSVGSSVIIDIAAHLPANTVSGVIFLCPMPYVGDITPRVATSTAMEHVGILQSNDDATRAMTYKSSWIDNCFGMPEEVPYAVKYLWKGAALAATPLDQALFLSRPQNLAPMLKLAASGSMPFLMLMGDADRLVDVSKIVPEVKAMWKNAKVVVMKGIGHSPFYEDAEGTMRHIGDFVEKNALSQQHIAKL